MGLSFQVVAETDETVDVLVVPGLIPPETSDDVKTPNGSYVAYYIQLSDGAVDVSDEYGFPAKGEEGITVKKYLGRATLRYNCHSYAWHDQNIDDNIYWINCPDIYITDGSYTLVTGTPQPGDIVCYIDDDASAGETRIHSGIVIEIVGSSASFSGVIMQSKWGRSGLFEHRGDQSPYIADGADRLEYYRRTNHTHSFDYTTANVSACVAEDMADCHKKYCTSCGVTIWQEHTITYTHNASTHTATCVCGFTETVEHSRYTVVDNSEDDYHLVECRCGYEFEEAHQRLDHDASTHTGECYICDHLSDENEPHTFVYSNNFDGSHTVSCTGCYYTAVELHTLWYGETILEYHEVYCGHCSYFEEQDHSWDDAYDEEGDHYNYCMQCGYVTYYMPMSIEAFAALPEEVQKALAEAVGSQTEDFMMYLDAERGVLCYHGTLYLFDIPNDVAVTSYPQPIPVSEDLLQILHPLPELK